MGDEEDSSGEPTIPTPGEAAASPNFDAQSGRELVEQLPDSSEVPSHIRRAFWIVVFNVNIAVLGISIGIAVIVLLRWWRVGLASVLIGTVFAGLAYYRYWRFHQRTNADGELIESVEE